MARISIIKNYPTIIGLLCILINSFTSYSQSLNLVIESNNTNEQRVIDSIGYAKVFQNFKTLNEASIVFYKKAQTAGYIDALKSKLKQVNDSTYKVTYDLGPQTKVIQIHLNEQLSSSEKQILGLDSSEEIIEVPISILENQLNQINSALVESGNPFALVKLINIRKSNLDSIEADLILDESSQRRIDKIVIKGYEKFPKSYLKRFLRINENDIFKIETINSKASNLANLRFASQIKEPEVLFTQDSTILYLYLEKTPSNNFDGFLGFGTNEENNRLELDGYLNLQLINNLNYGEELWLSYKSDEIDQQTFDVKLKMPFIFKSPIGIDLGLNIFRKDSTFATATQDVKLKYQIDNRQNLGLGIRGINSTNLLDNDSNILQDYQSTFYLLSYNYVKPQLYDLLFPTNTYVDISFGTGNRETNALKTNQTSVRIESFKIFNLNDRNSVFLRGTGAGLWSDNYFDNELFRFGGNNSIRGFEENSIVANLFGVLNTEYRYRLSNTLFVNSIIDAAYFENSLTDSKEKLFGFGFGFGLLTQAGLFRFNYASSKTESQPFRLSNSKVHISLIATF